jgi:hypothetical protein
MAKVKALVPFSSAHAGSREAGEQFDYDVDKDPAKLLAEGKVELVPSRRRKLASNGRSRRQLLPACH